MRTPLAAFTVTVGVAASLLLVGCSSSNGSPSASASTGAVASAPAEGEAMGWTTPDAALAALKAAGFSCPWTGTGSQLIVAGQVPSPAASGAQAPTQSGVRCDGYAIALLPSRKEWIAQLATGCAPITEAQATAPGALAPFVLGEDYVMMGMGAAGEFPSTASPESLAKAFKGEQTTMLGLYKLACGEDIVTKGSAVPSPAAS